MDGQLSLLFAALCTQSMQTRLGWHKLVFLPGNIIIFFKKFTCFYFKILSGFLPHPKDGWTMTITDKSECTIADGPDRTDGWRDGQLFLPLIISLLTSITKIVCFLL